MFGKKKRKKPILVIRVDVSLCKNEEQQAQVLKDNRKLALETLEKIGRAGDFDIIVMPDFVKFQVIEGGYDE